MHDIFIGNNVNPFSSSLNFVVNNTQHSNNRVAHYYFSEVDKMIEWGLTNAVFHVRPKGTPRTRFFNNWTKEDELFERNKNIANGITALSINSSRTGADNS